jgi:hypothetical protein
MFFCSSVARGGAMGHLHPPRQYYYALNRLEFLFFINKNPSKISGYDTGLLMFAVDEFVYISKLVGFRIESHFYADETR